MEIVVLMGAGEIRRRLGVSRQRVYQIVRRRDFPDPYQVLDMGKVWNAVEVEQWIRVNRPHRSEGPVG